MLNDRKNKKWLKNLLIITSIFTLIGLIINSGARCSIYVGPPNILPNPYPNGGIYPPPIGLNGGYLNPYQTPIMSTSAGTSGNGFTGNASEGIVH